MSQIGRILTTARLAPPVKALFVYNSNPAAVAPEQERVRAGFAREDLFTVVHELFATDTVDFADIVLPATTTLEHYDIHKAYGHLYLSLSRPAIAPLGESKPNTEVFRLLAARMGLDHPALRESDEEMARAAMNWDHPHLKGIDFDRLEREGSVRLSVGDPYAPFAAGGFPTPSGKCELYAARLEGGPHDPLAGYVPPRENVTSNPELARRYPLAFISPPAHHFLNSTFSAQPIFVRRESEPTLTIHPDDAAARGIADGRQVRTFNDRGSFLATARVSDDARPGVVVGPVHLVVEDVPRRPQRQRGHRPGADRHGRGRDLLRRPRRSRPRVTPVDGLFVAAAVITLVQFCAAARPAPRCRSPCSSPSWPGRSARAVGGRGGGDSRSRPWRPASPCWPCSPSRTTPRAAPGRRDGAHAGSSPLRRVRDRPRHPLSHAASSPRTRSSSCRPAGAACW